MHRKSVIICVFFIFVFGFLLAGCSSQPSDFPSEMLSEEVEEEVEDEMEEKADETEADNLPEEKEAADRRTTVSECLIPESSGTVVYEEGTVAVDASNTSEGYVMVCYQGEAAKVKLQITVPDATTYTYTLGGGEYETFPMSSGDGNYKLDVYENVRDDMYALIFTQDIEVRLTDEFRPFLYPNQYAWYTRDDEAVACGGRLSDVSWNDLDYVEQVYLYITDNIVYDVELAATVQGGYLPDADRTLQTKKGICFDYASLMAVMLRSQGIPTKLQIGYSGEAYHAWISVYLTETGWVDKIIEFDGKNWSLMDPTLAASNSRESLKKYIGDGSNYSVKYSY